jgi:ABC-type glycerol-3-phosphate transport system substrate-binding protein
MRRKTFSWLAVAVLVAALGLSACGGGSTPASPAPASPTGMLEGNAR